MPSARNTQDLSFGFYGYTEQTETGIFPGASCKLKNHLYSEVVCDTMGFRQPGILCDHTAFLILLCHLAKKVE